MKSIREALEAIKKDKLYRRLRCVGSPQGAEFVLDGERVINFSGNDTLGLAAHPALAEAARDCLDRFGFGSGASRLISGNMQPHEELEKALADFLDRERALYFSSGFQANTGCLPALVNEGDAVLSDELNHASLIDGIRLAKGERIVYPHNDADAVRRILGDLPKERRAVLVTESLFSMEGDRAPIEAFAELKRKRPFLFYLDEAHALGAAGPGGRGLAAEAGRLEAVDVLLGTLGKAFGASGAFIAAKREVIELLVNRARSFIYTTAPPPMVAAAAQAALAEVKAGDALRERLKENAAGLRDRFEAILGQRPPGEDHIIPVFIPGADRVMKVCAALLERRVFCQGIRPPTVPAGRCRLRFSVTALHDEKHLDHAARSLEEVLKTEIDQE